MTVKEFISKFHPEIIMEAEKMLRFDPFYGKQLTEADKDFIRANKPEIIKAIETEKAEKKAATVSFYSTGWEVHEVTVDTRHSIDDQLAKIAKHYPDDCTLDSLRKDYAKAIAKKEETEKKRQEEDAKIAAIRDLAVTTGEKQVIAHYPTSCDGTTLECSYDIVTVWAMPDGTEMTTRQHTW